MATYEFEAPDFYQLDDLLSDEQKLVRDTVRNFANVHIKPIIEEYCQKAQFPRHLVKEFGNVGVFGPFVPTEYGGGGLDYISYGLMMQELERQRMIYRYHQSWASDQSFSMETGERTPAISARLDLLGIPFHHQ